jgi:hypothetical protein
MNDCDGCSVSFGPCIIIQKKQDKNCPCKICIVKMLCKSVLDICEPYEKLLDYCNDLEVSNE